MTADDPPARAATRRSIMAAAMVLVIGGCAEHLRNPLSTSARDRLWLASIRVDMIADGGPLRGIGTEDAASLAAKIEDAVRRMFESRIDPGAPDAVEMRVVVTKFGVAHGAVAAVGGQVAHHVDGRADLFRGGGLLASYPVNVYRETGGVGVLIGAARGRDPGAELADAFARELYTRFSTG